MPLSGTHLVRALRSALQSAKHFWPKAKDRMEVRRNALKLRFWGKRHASSDTVLDVSYESIKAMQGSGIYEVRIDDEVGGMRNIRVIFFDPPADWKSLTAHPLPVIWVLEVLPKKRQEWTNFDLKRFRAKREIVKERFYSA